MTRRRITKIMGEDIDRWGKKFARVYELQGPASFEKYQYSIANIIRFRANQKSGEQLLKYVRDIARPKDVLFEALISIMFNDFVNTSSRILVVEALRVLTPKRPVDSRYTRESVIRAMEDVFNSPQISALHHAIKKAMKSINTEIQQNNLKQILSLTVERELTP